MESSKIREHKIEVLMSERRFIRLINIIVIILSIIFVALLIVRLVNI